MGRAAIESLTSPRAMINVASEVSMVDDGVGRVLAALEAAGLARDTLVIFASDQGSAFGQKGLWGNSSWGSPYPAYNANMQIPLIVRQPGQIPAGRRSDHTVNEFDLLPTILDYVGLGDRRIAGTPGRSHASAASVADADGDEQPVFFEYITTRVIQTREWKYIRRFLDAPDELYDLAQGPRGNPQPGGRSGARRHDPRASTRSSRRSSTATPIRAGTSGAAGRRRRCWSTATATGALPSTSPGGRRRSRPRPCPFAIARRTDARSGPVMCPVAGRCYICPVAGASDSRFSRNN